MKKIPKRKYNRKKWIKRLDPGYEDFRKKVLKRDRYTCQFPNCGYKVRRFLNVHHCYLYSKYPQYRTDPNYSICLCYRCHKSIRHKEHLYIELFLKIINENTKRV